MLHISVVDDDREHSSVLTGYLERYFSQTQNETSPAALYECRVFADGSEYLANMPPETDILFLDIIMSKTNGIETARRVREFIIPRIRLVRYQKSQPINPRKAQTVIVIVVTQLTVPCVTLC